MMDQESLQQFRAEVIARKNLPTIPPVLAGIVALIDSDTAGARRLVELIERDQSLTAKLLRLANSAFFGQSRRVSTVPRAILLLGFSTVRNLALGVKVWEALGGDVTRRRLEELWAHAVTVAVCAKAMAGRLRACDPDEAFTAGLLHDVGRLVIAVRFRDMYWDTVGGASEAEAVEARERETFGVDHAEVGGWLLEAWALPPIIVEAVRQHHDDEPRAGLPRVLAMTNRLVSWTDVAAGTARPEAEAYLEPIADQTLTLEAWLQMVGELRDGGLLGTIPLE
jgi:putative nucleotidyltransferase with HDIG domain